MASIGDGVGRGPSTQGQGQPAIAEDNGAANGQTAIPRESPKRAPAQTGEAFLDGVQAQSTPSMPSPAASPLTQRRVSSLTSPKEGGDEHAVEVASAATKLGELVALALDTAHGDIAASAATKPPNPVVFSAEQKKDLGSNVFYMPRLDNAIAKSKKALDDGTWANEVIDVMPFTPALVALENHKKSSFNLKYCANPQEFAAQIAQCIQDKTSHAQFLFNSRNTHVAYLDYQLTAHGVPSVICVDSLDYVSAKADINKTLESLNQGIQFSGVQIGIQKSDSECPIFALNLAKQVYKAPGTLNKMHEFGGLERMGRSLLDSTIPPVLMKHSQSTKRTDDYIANNKNAKNDQVSSQIVSRKVRNGLKGQTLKEYQKAHTKQTSSGEKKVRTIFEKRLDYLQELRAAFADGGADTTQDYFDALLLKLKTMESLDSDHVVSLLEDKDRGGIPGLQAALHEGHAAVVRGYLGIFSRLKDLGIDLRKILTSDQILKIVEAKNKEREPGLLAALQKGHADTVKAFLEALPKFKDLGLDDAQIKTILKAEDSDGIPGLTLAIMNNKPAAIKAYFEEIKTLGFDQDKTWIKSIFEVKNGSCTPGLVLALRVAQSDTKDVLYQELRKLGFEEAWIQGLEKQA